MNRSVGHLAVISAIVLAFVVGANAEPGNSKSHSFLKPGERYEFVILGGVKDVRAKVLDIANENRVQVDIIDEDNEVSPVWVNIGRVNMISRIPKPKD
jgi:hypothetical protein